MRGWYLLCTQAVALFCQIILQFSAGSSLRSSSVDFSSRSSAAFAKESDC